MRDANDDKGPVHTSDLPCDVRPLVETYCGTCHGERPSFGAQVSLFKAADFAKVTPARVKARLSDPDPREAMPPTTSKKPTASERAQLDAWLDLGAPAGTAACAVAPQRDAGTDGGHVSPADEELECYKLLAHDGDGKSPFRLGVAIDTYYNFTFKAPWKGTAYGIVLSPIIDNADALHHWLLFQDDVPGLPSGAVPSIGAHPAGQMLTGWAPGADPLDFRLSGVDVGLELPGDNQTYTIEFHYNSADGNAVDASGVEICVRQRKTENIAGMSWLGNDQLLVPSTKWTGVCRPLSQQPIHILAVIPHMHKQGVHMKGIITRVDGKQEVLHDEPFNFNYQRTYNKNVTLMPGESILTECTYAQPMAFGQRTDEEMCYLFTVAYPKGALAGLDLWGRFAHGASSCLGQ